MHVCVLTRFVFDSYVDLNSDTLPIPALKVVPVFSKPNIKHSDINKVVNIHI